MPAMRRRLREREAARKMVAIEPKIDARRRTRAARAKPPEGGREVERDEPVRQRNAATTMRPDEHTAIALRWRGDGHPAGTGLILTPCRSRAEALRRMGTCA